MAVICVLASLMLLCVCQATVENGRPSEVYLNDLVNEYGTNGKLSVQQLEKLLVKLNVNGISSDQGNGDGEVKTIQEEQTCYTAEKMMQIYNLDSEDEIDRDMMSEMCPLILHQIESGQCAPEDNFHDLKFEEIWLERSRRSSNDNGTESHGEGPTTQEIWGYGTLSVAVISMLSLVGVLVVPFMGKKLYQNVLRFLICLAVGTLSGSALLHLIPAAHDIHADKDYIFKQLTIVAGIYLFFLTERFLKMCMAKRKRRVIRKKAHMDVADSSVIANRGGIEHVTNPVYTHRHSSQDQVMFNGTVARLPEKTDKECEDGHVGLGHKNCSHTELIMADDKSVATVAYMIIFGDGLHNFIDGLALGAGFSKSLLKGLSISLAILCEELPHELGDFAILLNSGMSVKKALCYNFLSALMCFLGLVCGIFLSELTEGAPWIFALAAGMFLYISLVDMLPELNIVEEDEDNSNGSSQSMIFFLQNCGLIIGWGIILVLSIYEHDIKHAFETGNHH